MTDKAIGAHMKLRRAAVLLDKSERWVKDQIKDGQIEGYRLGNEWVVSVRSLNEFLEKRKVGKATSEELAEQD